MKIEDIGNVIEDIDRTGSRYRSDEGRIMAIHNNNDRYVCHGCVGYDITSQATCLFCNTCRS